MHRHIPTIRLKFQRCAQVFRCEQARTHKQGVYSQKYTLCIILVDDHFSKTDGVVIALGQLLWMEYPCQL